MCINIHEALDKLFKNRPIFHSEDDFKFALAWQIQLNYEDVEIRLERVYNGMHIDIVAMYKEHIIGIELKYPTKQKEITHNKEQFTLTYHGGQGQKRFEFYKDINRLELLKMQGLITAGHAILLTNDLSYRNPPSADSATNNTFNIEDKHTITNKSYEWTGDRSREGQKIDISETYHCEWCDLVGHKDLAFTYLHLEI